MGIKIMSKGSLAVIAASVLLSAMVLGCNQASGGATDETPIETINFVKMADTYYQFKTNDSQNCGKCFYVVGNTKPKPGDTLAVKCKKVSGNIDGAMGIIFFRGSDFKNFYVFLIKPSGHYKIERMINGDWEAVTPWIYAQELHEGLGVENKIAIVPSADNTFTIKVNDITGSSYLNDKVSSCPADGYCGFYAEISAAEDEQFPGTPEDMRFLPLSN